MTLQSVITMEDLQRAADIDSQLAAGSIMNQVLDDQETRDEMLCDMLDIDSGMMEDVCSRFGYLPKMALASKGMMASLMAASFCERINSCANIVVTKDNSLLSDDEIDKVVTLRMNRDFMEYMRTYYPEVIKSVHPKYGTVINADDVRQQREKEDAEPEADLFRG